MNTTCTFPFEKSSITLMVELYNLMYAKINYVHAKSI